MNKFDWDILARCGVTPENAATVKFLGCSGTGITALPDMPALKVLYCSNTGITALPDMPALKVLYCSNTGITALPDMPKLERLYCSRTGITALHDMPKLGWLHCSHTGITALPDMPALEWLSCYNTGLSLLDDGRGYSLARVGDLYFAGCRRFTAAEAIAHWGSPDYPDPERGAKYVAAVQAEEARRAA